MAGSDQVILQAFYRQPCFSSLATVNCATVSTAVQASLTRLSPSPLGIHQEDCWIILPL